MDALRNIVVALATMSESQLREARHKVEGMSGDRHAKELVLNLIDVYIHVGEDPQRRAKAAAACLLAIDEVEKSRGSGGSSGTPSPVKRSGCASVLILLIAIAAGAWLCF